MDKKEIRSILLGKLVRTEDRVWTVAPEGTRIPFQGMSDGSGDVRLFGITCRQRSYRAEENLDELFSAARDSLEEIGKPLRLKSAPRAAACLYRSLLTAPVLLVLEEGKKTLTLSAYTGRAIMAGFSCSTAARVLEQRMNGKLLRTEKDLDDSGEPDKEEKTPKTDSKGKKKSRS